jgi:hypothetical protein
MRQREITIGNAYEARVSGKVTTVRILRKAHRKGWIAKNEATGREVQILTAQRLRPLPAERPSASKRVQVYYQPVTNDDPRPCLYLGPAEGYSEVDGQVMIRDQYGEFRTSINYLYLGATCNGF